MIVLFPHFWTFDFPQLFNFLRIINFSLTFIDFRAMLWSGIGVSKFGVVYVKIVGSYTHVMVIYCDGQ